MITERKDARGNLVPFDFKAITLNGELVEGRGVVCTSSNNKNRTRNIKWPESKEMRKFRDISIIELNGQEVTV